MRMLKEFKEFAVKGNAVDMAVGIVIGAAFGKIINSLVSDIIMPPVGLLLGGVDFKGLFINLGPEVYTSLAEAKAAAPKAKASTAKKPRATKAKTVKA